MIIVISMLGANRTSSLDVGAVIGGRYRVECVLGRGGMGVVVGAVHVDLGQRYALKLLKEEHSNDKEVVERLMREARAAVSLKNDHVAKVFDVGRLPSGAPYIVMEYLEGRDVGAIVEQGPLSIGTAVGIIAQACKGLAEAHINGIVHRDVKPHNLFVTQTENGRARVKVLDFGIARHMNAATKLTQTATVIGSPPYMAPEQMVAGEVDSRTDVWSLGATLYELLIGRPPFPGATMPEIYAHIVQAPPQAPHVARPEIPEALSNVVLSCLKKSADERPKDAAELGRMLVPFVPEDLAVSVARLQPVIAWGATTRLEPIRPQRRWQLFAAIGAGCFIAFAIFLFVAFWPSDTQRTGTGAPPAATSTAQPVATQPPVRLDPPPTTPTATQPSTTSTTTKATTARPVLTVKPPTTKPSASASSKPPDDPFQSRKW